MSKCRHSPDLVCDICEPPLDPRITEHIECDCVPSLGPSHCHLCDTAWEHCDHHTPETETTT